QRNHGKQRISLHRCFSKAPHISVSARQTRQPLEIIRTLAAAVMTACSRLSGSEIGIVVVRLPHALGRLEQLALAWQPLLGASQVFVFGFVVADGRMLLKPPPSPRPRPWRAAIE